MRNTLILDSLFPGNTDFRKIRPSCLHHSLRAGKALLSQPVSDAATGGGRGHQPNSKRQDTPLDVPVIRKRERAAREVTALPSPIL